MQNCIRLRSLLIQKLPTIEWTTDTSTYIHTTQTCLSNHTRLLDTQTWQLKTEPAMWPIHTHQDSYILQNFFKLRGLFRSCYNLNKKQCHIHMYNTKELHSVKTKPKKNSPWRFWNPLTKVQGNRNSWKPFQKLPTHIPGFKLNRMRVFVFAYILKTQLRTYLYVC